jgi:PilZ domain
MQPVYERRGKQRFALGLTVHFRLSVKGFQSRWGTGTMQDMSSTGVSFRSRRQLPVGGHVELIIDWPAVRTDHFPVALHATGLVVRSSGSKTAVQIPSHRFRIQTETAHPMGALA